MLSSGQFQDLQRSEKYQVSLVTAVVLSFIAACAFLLFAGLAREIWLARNINSNMTKARWRIAIKRQIKINNKKRARVKRFQNVVYEIMKKEGRSMQSVIMLAGFSFFASCFVCCVCTSRFVCCFVKYLFSIVIIFSWFLEPNKTMFCIILNGFAFCFALRCCMVCLCVSFVCHRWHFG